MSGSFHPGEVEAQFRFNDNWSESRRNQLASIYRQAIDDETALFIEGAPFFFLATADQKGRCDCSFKGTEPGAEGKLAPAALVPAPKQILFPDYAGNRMFNSLGNILSNPHVGLIFIDFPAQLRLRINGGAEVTELEKAYLNVWPNAKRLVRVQVEQVYWNCPNRIPVDPR